MKKYIILLGLALAGMLFGTNQSFACSCMMPEDALTSMSKSDLVFTATVKDVSPNRNQTWNTVSMEVNENFKGVDSDMLEVTTGSSSAACGINFEKNKSYLVYAYKNGDDISTGLCSRTTLLENAGEDIEALGKNRKSFSSQKIFEMAQGKKCLAATDGCNNLIMSDGKIIGSTQMYCPDHTPEYSCTQWIEDENEDSVYDSQEAFLETKGKYCKTATDGVNSHFIENGEIVGSTRVAYPENFKAQWKCIKEEEPLMCTAQYDPVCGVDGKTYGNLCMAHKVEVAHKGECGDTHGLSNAQYDILIDYSQKLDAKLSNMLYSALDRYSDKVEQKKHSEQVLTHRAVLLRADRANDSLLSKYENVTELPRTAKQIQMTITVLKLKVTQMLNDLN